MDRSSCHAAKTAELLQELIGFALAVDNAPTSPLTPPTGSRKVPASVQHRQVGHVAERQWADRVVTEPVGSHDRPAPPAPGQCEDPLRKDSSPTSSTRIPPEGIGR
jgi:hypothetical protein